MKLAREDEREVAIAVPENRLAELKNANALGVVLWADATRVHPARIREIAPAVDPVTRTARGNGEGIVEVELRATNDRGDHLSGTAVLSLPLTEAPR